MTGRPTDWSPLDLSQDPVPGDADEVEIEARYYTGVAEQISDQVRRLRTIGAGDGTLQGDYSDALRDSCDELAGDLAKAHGRFDTVGTELTGLVDDLRLVLKNTASALDDAVTARADMGAATSAGYSPGLDLLGETVASPDGEADPDLVAAKQKYHAADGDLESAKGKCSSAVSAYDEVASGAAGRIRDASADDLKDGRFDGFKAWVKANAGWLKELSTWLGRIVLVLAVAIVLLSNPAGWLVAVALLSSVALLAVDTMLAVAGEGSWTDVAFSAIGVLTLGAGSVVGKLARFGRSLTLFKAGNQQGLRTGMQTLRNAFNNPGLRGAMTNLGNVVRPGSYLNALDDGLRTARAVRSLPLQAVPVTSRSMLFGREAMGLSDDLARIRLDFGDDVVSGLHAGSVRGLKAFTAVGGVNTAVDAAMDEGVLGLDGLDDLADRISTREVSTL